MPLPTTTMMIKMVAVMMVVMMMVKMKKMCLLVRGEGDSRAARCAGQVYVDADADDDVLLVGW
jgi:hypothetical protein